MHFSILKKTSTEHFDAIFHSKGGKLFLGYFVDKILLFYERFSRNCQISAIFEVRKNFQPLKFRHVIHHRIYNLFPEIFKNRENMSNNRFREIHKAFLKSRNLNISCYCYSV